MRHATIAPLVIALLLAGCSTREERIAEGLQKAERFTAVADWDKAGVEVRNVLQIEPKTARAHHLAARVAEGQADPKRAYSHLLKAVELQPQFADAQVDLARLQLLAGDVERADAAVRSVLGAEPGHVGARTIAAAVLARRGMTDQALAASLQLLEAQKPVPVEATMLASGLMMNQGRPAQALQTLERALADHPRNISLLQVAAQVAAAEGPTSTQRAVDYFQRAVAEAPRSDALRRSWAQMHLARGDVDAAENVLREALTADRSSAERQRMLLDFIARHRGREAAEKAYLAAIDEQPREPALRFGLVQLYREAGRAADAERVLKRVVEDFEAAPAALQARSELASDRFTAGRVSEARALVTEVLKANPRDTSGLLLRGRIHLVDGKPRDAVIDLRTVARDRPGVPQVVALLSQAHRAAGEPELAREVTAEAVKAQPGDASLRMLHAATLAEQQDPRAAMVELDAAIAAEPRNVKVYEQKARLALAAGDRSLAEQTFAALKKSLPDAPTGHLYLGKFFADTGRGDAALKEYEAGMARFPTDPSLYIAAVALQVSQRRFDDALQRIARREAGDARNPLHPQLRGDVATARGDMNAAQAAYEAMISLAPSMPSGYVGLARTKARSVGLPAALEVLERGEARSGDDARLSVVRADFLTRAGKHDEAIAVYESVLKRAPDNDVAANNLAFLLAMVRRDAPSLERALALATRFEDSANAAQLDSLGYVYLRRGEFARAVLVLERARRLNAESPLIAMNLGLALVRAGEAERGRKLLREAIDSRAPLPDLQEAKALLAG